MDPACVTVKFRGQPFSLPCAAEDTLQTLAERTAIATGTALKSVKFVTSQAVLQPKQHPHATLASLGVLPGAQLVLLASTVGEVAELESARSDPTQLGLAAELERHERRRNRGPATPQLPTEYTFGQYVPWERQGLAPPPSEALKLLHRLAADPGIVAIMAKHRWDVGKLSEMPPEGLVGVSPACLLGVNINRGQEISLRLRTDDLGGFRRFDSILETLCHELAHMVFGPHDNNFKELNSKLLRECRAANAAYASAHVLGGELGPDLAPPPGGRDRDPPRAPRGHKLGGAPAASAQNPWRRNGASPPSAGSSSTPTALSPPALSPQPTTPPPELAETGLAVRVEGLGHRHAATEAAERAAQELGRLEEQMAAAPPAPDAASALPQAPPLEGNRPPLESPSAPSFSTETIPSSQPVSTQAAGDELMEEAEQQPLAGSRQAASRGGEGGIAAERPGREGAVAGGGGQPGANGPAGVEDGGEEAGDEGTRRFRSAQRELQRLGAGAGAEQALALSTLATVLQNALQAGADPRFRRVRADPTSAFHRRAGRFGGAAELLGVAGFEPERDPAGATAFLCLRRNDPGLLWLALSAVQGQLQQSQA